MDGEARIGEALNTSVCSAPQSLRWLLKRRLGQGSTRGFLPAGDGLLLWHHDSPSVPSREQTGPHELRRAVGGSRCDAGTHSATAQAFAAMTICHCMSLTRCGVLQGCLLPVALSSLEILYLAALDSIDVAF